MMLISSSSHPKIKLGSFGKRTKLLKVGAILHIYQNQISKNRRHFLSQIMPIIWFGSDSINSFVRVSISSMSELPTDIQLLMLEICIISDAHIHGGSLTIQKYA